MAVRPLTPGLGLLAMAVLTACGGRAPQVPATGECDAPGIVPQVTPAYARAG